MSGISSRIEKLERAVEAQSPSSNKVYIWTKFDPRPLQEVEAEAERLGYQLVIIRTVSSLNGAPILPTEARDGQHHE